MRKYRISFRTPDGASHEVEIYTPKYKTPGNILQTFSDKDTKKYFKHLRVKEVRE